MIPLGHISTWKPNVPSPYVGYSGLVPFLKALQDQNDDALVLLDGLEGSGKSTVGFHLARHVAFDVAKSLDECWQPETGLIIDFDDWMKVYDLGEGRVFVLDEGGDLMFSRDAMSGENKLLVRMFQMARIYNHIIIVCCPNIHWVDLYIRSHRALIYGHVVKTYHAKGVNRGQVKWHWPSRKWDWEKSEWKTRWMLSGTSRFKAVDNDDQWKEYEEFKRLKVQIRQLELQEKVSKRRK